MTPSHAYEVLKVPEACACCAETTDYGFWCPGCRRPICFACESPQWWSVECKQCMP